MKTFQRVLKIIFTLLIFIFCRDTSVSQVKMKQIDMKEKSEVIQSITKLLKDNYVFPEKAEQMAETLSENLRSGNYENVTDAIQFSDKITKDLQSVSKDKHLRVMFNPEDAKAMMNSGVGNKGEDKPSPEMIEEMKYENYAFKKVERLNGNIGYVDFRNFVDAEYSKQTIEAVMGFLSNCDAIIFDLRQNGGGDPKSVQLITSYLFDETPVHLNDLYYRPENKTEEYWTLKDIKGKRMPDVDVYVLTSNFTFSGAEEFSYNLKNLKRATIIGETTGGGAHPGDVMAVNNDFIMFVPKGRAINPITKTNWEGTGVIPDIEVAQEKALEIAKLTALEKLSQKASDNNQKQKLLWEADAVKAALNPVVLNEDDMRKFTGKYGEREITFENNKLYYKRAGRPKMMMIAMTHDLFMFNEVGYFRIKFKKDSSGNVVELDAMYDNGNSDVTPKN